MNKNYDDWNGLYVEEKNDDNKILIDDNISKK